MSIDKTYRCDVCNSTGNPDTMTGIHWDSTNGMTIVLRPPKTVEHHICERCFKALASAYEKREAEGI